MLSLDPLTVDDQIRSLQSLPASARRDALRRIASLEHPVAIKILAAVVNSDSDQNSKAIAIKALGRIGDAEIVPILLPHLDEHRAVVIKSLLSLGVFDHVMPDNARERRIFRKALQFAKPDLRALIADQEVNHETLRAVLPPMM